MAVARRRGVDTIRRAVTLQNKVELLGRELSDHETPMDELEVDPHVEEDVLRLKFTACHPVLPVEARMALTLRMVAGLSTEQIARAFLVWARAELCQEAMRLGRMLAALAAGESETHALVALMELQASRLRARTGPGGEIGTLGKQDRARWDPVADHARPRRAGAARGHRLGAHRRPLRRPRRPDPLRHYHLLPAVRGDLLAKLGRSAEARAEFEPAAERTSNEAERTHLRARAGRS